MFATTALADDQLCVKLDDLLSNKPRYTTDPAINGEFGVSSFYTDANGDKLYALSSINIGTERYEAA
jgi:hypothetical protein